MIGGGLLPFNAASIGAVYVISSLRSHQLEHLAGVVFLAFLLSMMACSQISIVLCYFHLCAEVILLWSKHSVTQSRTIVGGGARF